MDPRDFFRAFFGFSRPGFGDGKFQTPDDDYPEGRGPGVNDGDDDDDYQDHFGQRRRPTSPFGDNFAQVFTNPLEMERFFNGQIESILKSFGINDGFFSFPHEPSKIPSLPAPDDPDAVPGSGQEVEPGSRDFMLKRDPGFLPPVTPGQGRDDVIDKITPNELDKLYSDDDGDVDKFRGPNFHPPTGFGGFFGPGMGFGGIFGPGGGFSGLFGEGHGPSNPFPGPTPFPNPNFGGQSDDEDGGGQDRGFGDGPFGRISTFSFGRSITQSTVVLPDGTVEERRTVRDSDGTESTTVTRRSGGKTETETTTRKSDGSGDRRIQDFGSFIGRDSNRSPRSEMLQPVPEVEKPTYRSIFSKFFGN